jgi:8-oxo-dGTP pyrophosphatase MutT (NUDIX family)
MIDGMYYESPEKSVNMFNNKPNECVTLADGRKIWLSRSSAVVITIIIRNRRGEYKCLLVKRGPGCPDEVGRWVLPCGYLDWNETLDKAALRELYEETGFSFSEFCQEYGDRVVLDNFVDGQPWYVNSSSSDTKQNVSNCFGAYIELGHYDYNLPTLTARYSETNEVAE